MKNHLCFKAYSGAFWGKAVVLAFCITLLAGCGSDVPEDCVIFHSEQEMIDTIQGSWFNYLKIGFDISAQPQLSIFSIEITLGTIGK